MSAFRVLVGMRRSACAPGHPNERRNARTGATIACASVRRDRPTPVAAAREQRDADVAGVDTVDAA
jgi:hypothetical protein